MNSILSVLIECLLAIYFFKAILLYIIYIIIVHHITSDRVERPNQYAPWELQVWIPDDI